MSVVKKESGFFFRQLSGEYAAESCLYEKVSVSDIDVCSDSDAEFLSQIKEGDEVWSFTTPVYPLDARGGYAIVRNEKVVAVLTTILS
jgi:hypothetical protein